MYIIWFQGIRAVPPRNELRTARVQRDPRQSKYNGGDGGGGGGGGGGVYATS